MSQTARSRRDGIRKGLRGLELRYYVILRSRRAHALY